jgi:hypothetical protein
LNGFYSDWAKVQSGVPQGSVLGPLLFLIYINDITKEISCNIRLFADDCILYKEIKNQEDSILLQRDLDKLVKWSEQWQMRFNVKKCSIMQISNKRNKTGYNYTMNNTILQHVTSHPYLGVEIQDDLRWDDHINKITNKASRTLGMLRRNLWGCNVQTKSLAYLSLVRPQIEFAASVWDPHLKKHCHKLDMIQRRGARFAVSDYRTTSSASEMIDRLKWQDLAVRRKVARLSMFYKAIKGTVDICLTDLQKPIRSTRNSSSLSYILPSTRSDTLKYSFFPRTVADWNSLPVDILSSSSLDSFKAALGRHFV